MRSGPVRRCASYCTWSSRSRTTVVESADDQWRTPVIRGNFDNSCAVAGELLDALVSEIASGVAFAPDVRFEGATEGAAEDSFAGWSTASTGVFSVIIALPSCVALSFHQTPPANAAAITTQITRISTTGFRVSASASAAAILTSDAISAAAAVASVGAFSATG